MRKVEVEVEIILIWKRLRVDEGNLAAKVFYHKLSRTDDVFDVEKTTALSTDS